MPMVKIWDPLLRLFHWSLAAAFALAWLTAEDMAHLHEWTGYAAGGLIAFRLIWGLIGPRYARFSQFLTSPQAVLAYIRAALRGDEPRYLGHNPAGAAMILLLLVSLAGTVWTGWLAMSPAYHASAWVREGHNALATVTLILIGLHIAGVIYASARHHENLAAAMLTGKKRSAGPADFA
jgi:cytochrome b